MNLFMQNDDENLVIVGAVPAMLPLLQQSDAELFGEKRHGPAPWTELQWRGLMSLHCDPTSPEQIAVLAERVGGKQLCIKGWAVWTAERSAMRLQKIAVQKSCRGCRFGQRMLNMPWANPVPLFADVHERDLMSQKFFRGCGWLGKAACHLDGEGIIRFTPLTGDNAAEPEPSRSEQELNSAAAPQTQRRRSDKELN